MSESEEHRWSWERDWERARELGLPEPATLEPGERHPCERAPHGNPCLNPATSVFTFPSGKEWTYSCNVHKARTAAIVALMFELRRQNSPWGRLTFRRLHNREYKEALDTLIR